MGEISTESESQYKSFSVNDWKQKIRRTVFSVGLEVYSKLAQRHVWLF
jgi:hypothetical protein